MMSNSQSSQAFLMNVKISLAAASLRILKKDGSYYIYFQKNQIQCNTKKKKKRRKRTCWSKTPPGLKNFISFMKKQIRIWKNFTKRNSAFGESISQYDLNTLKEIWWQQQNFVTFNREPRKSFLKVTFKLFLNVSDCKKT